MTISDVCSRTKYISVCQNGRMGINWRMLHSFCVAPHGLAFYGTTLEVTNWRLGSDLFSSYPSSSLRNPFLLKVHTLTSSHLQIPLCRILIFTILILPIHEHGIFLDCVL